MPYAYAACAGLDMSWIRMKNWNTWEQWKVWWDVEAFGWLCMLFLYFYEQGYGKKIWTYYNVNPICIIHNLNNKKKKHLAWEVAVAWFTTVVSPSLISLWVYIVCVCEEGNSSHQHDIVFLRIRRPLFWLLAEECEIADSFLISTQFKRIFLFVFSCDDYSKLPCIFVR